jgi:hypothetical protein
MPIPDYQACMLHLLRLASDGAEHTLKGAVPALADIFHLTDAERTELLPSGQQAILNNRVAWAKTYLRFFADYAVKKWPLSEQQKLYDFADSRGTSIVSRSKSKQAPKRSSLQPLCQVHL